MAVAAVALVAHPAALAVDHAPAVRVAVAAQAAATAALRAKPSQLVCLAACKQAPSWSRIGKRAGAQ